MQMHVHKLERKLEAYLKRCSRLFIKLSGAAGPHGGVPAPWLSQAPRGRVVPGLGRGRGPTAGEAHGDLPALRERPDTGADRPCGAAVEQERCSRAPRKAIVLEVSKGSCGEPKAHRCKQNIYIFM